MELRPGQPEGVKHLLSMPFGKPHALLADEPGTGKTIMTAEASKKAGCKNGIIVCPPVIKEQWKRVATAWEMFAPDEVQVLYGLDAKLDNTPWKILNYELAREDAIRKQLLQRDWHVLVMDEAHRLKTHGSQQTKAVLGKWGIATKCYWKWALSGTIMPNRPIELYPMLRTLAPECIAPHDNWPAYIAHFCGGAASLGKGASNIPELTERIQPFMLKRDLRDMWPDCPPLIENEVWLDVADEVRRHPEWADAIYEPTERRVIAEAKAPAVAAYVKQRLDDGEQKICVFTYHKESTNILAKHLSAYGVAKINGEISASQRQKELAKFLGDPACRVFLVQYASGGEGLDGLQLVCAELVEAEPEWSPGREDQAIRRILRIGQTKTVILTRCFAANSYEEVIFRSNKRKRSVIEAVTKSNGGTFDMSLESTLEKILTQLTRLADANEKATSLFAAQSSAIEVKPPVSVADAALAGQLTVNAPNTIAAATLPQPAISNVVPMQQAQAVAAQMVPPAAPVAAVPAQAAAPVAAPSMDLNTFVKVIGEKVGPLGEAGMQRLAAVNAQFGVQKAGQVQPHLFEAFIASLNQALSA